MPVPAIPDTAAQAFRALDYRLLTPGDASCWVPNPQLDRLLDLWRARSRAKALPPRSCFTIEDLRPWLGRIAVSEVVGSPPRFRMVLHGTHLVENIGRDWTGLFLDEAVEPARRDLILRPYIDCATHLLPVFDTLPEDALPKAFAPADRLVLPCAEDGAQIDRIITCVLLSRRGPGEPMAAVAD